MDNLSEFVHWINSERREAVNSVDREKHNYVEITRLPKKIDSRSLTSLIVSASRVVPISTNIGIKQDNFKSIEHVALVEFRSEPDAYKAVDKLKLTAYGKLWQMKIMKNPNFASPTVEVMNKFIN